MLFRKNEKRHGASIIYLTIGTLAFIGALGVTAKGKKCFMTVKRKMKELFHPASGCDCEEA